MKWLFGFILMLCCTNAFGQDQCFCDSIYNEVEIPVEYNGKLIRLLSDVLGEEQNCFNPENLDSKLFISFLIDQTGKVIDVDLLRFTGSENCKSNMKKKLLEIDGFTPARNNGQKVCSRYYLPVIIDFKLDPDLNNNH